MIDWLKQQLGSKAGETVTIKPVYLDRIMIRCPECGAGGMWAVPEGFKVAIQSHLLVNCEKGHAWAISGLWAEEKAKDGEQP